MFRYCQMRWLLMYTDLGRIWSEFWRETVNDVTEAFEKLRVDKAIGLDAERNQKRHQLPLFLLFKKSFNESSVPDDWKCASITQIFKKGNRNAAENYRSASLTSQISRLFETRSYTLTLRGQRGRCRNNKGEPQIYGSFPSKRPLPLFLWVWFYGGPWQTQAVYQIWSH